MNCLLGSICIKRNQMCLACLLTIDRLPAWVYEWMNVVGLNLSFWADNLILVCSCLAACIAGLSRDLSDHLPCACMWCDASATPAVYVQKHRKTTIPSSNEQIADASGVRTVEWIGRHTMIQSQSCGNVQGHASGWHVTIIALLPRPTRSYPLREPVN
jgi:hypothetical protein